MSFIAPTRPKKIKKLFLIAFSIINEWGWRYFFYIARKEWKDKGFSIFYPDQKPVPLFDRISFQEHYKKYLKFIEKIFSKNYSGTDPTKLTFLLYYDSKEVSSLQSTLKSFLDQSYKNWTLLLSLIHI